jgi:hypothetical protein
MIASNCDSLGRAQMSYAASIASYAIFAPPIGDEVALLQARSPTLAPKP